MFKLPIFQDKEFEKFVHCMKIHLDNVVDHSETHIEHIVSTVMHRFNIVEKKLNQGIQEHKEQK